MAETTGVKNGLECNKFSPESPQGYSLRSLEHIVKNCMIFLKHLECLSGISTGDCGNFGCFKGPNCFKYSCARTEVLAILFDDKV